VPGDNPAGLYRRLLALRQLAIVPRLPGSRALEAQSLGRATVVARWRMGDGSRLTIALNLDSEPCPCTLPEVPPIFESRPGAADHGRLAAQSAAAFLED